VQQRSLENAWVAVQVKLNREHVVSAILRRAGYEEFLPLYCPRSPGTTASRERPLFPGYLFCRYTTRIAYRIVQAPGVIRLVGESHAPLPVDEHEITAIQRVVRSGIYNEPWRFAEPGARVRIRVGPLCGLEGTLVTVRNVDRLIISVTLLQRAIAVTVRGTEVEMIEPAVPLQARSHGPHTTLTPAMRLA
jgi:transcription termination/antitermination protein NusG